MRECLTSHTLHAQHITHSTHYVFTCVIDLLYIYARKIMWRLVACSLLTNIVRVLGLFSVAKQC